MFATSSSSRSPCDFDDVQVLARGQSPSWLHHRMDHLLRPFKINTSHCPLMTPWSSLRSNPPRFIQRSRLLFAATDFFSLPVWIKWIWFCFCFVFYSNVWLESWVSVFWSFGEEKVFNRGTCLTATKEESRGTSDTWMTSNYFPCPSNCVLMQGCDQTWYEQLGAFKWKWLSAFVLRCRMNHS